MKKLSGGNCPDEKEYKIIVIDDSRQDILNAIESIKSRVCSSKFKCINSSFDIKELDNERADLIISELNSVFHKISDIIPTCIKLSIPIIVYTKQEKEKEANAALENGAWDYALKEYPQKLAILAERVLKEKETNRKLKYAAKDLNEYEKYIKRYKLWEDNVPAVLFRYIWHPNGTGSYIYISLNVKKMIGIDAIEIIKNPLVFQKLIYPDDLKKNESEFYLAAKELKSFTLEYRLIINNNIKWFSSLAYPEKQENDDIIWNGFFLDINDRKCIEEKLAEEHNLLRTIIDSLPDRIHAKDKKGRFIIANQAVLKLFNMGNQNEVVGKTDYDFRSKDIADAYNKSDQEVLTTGRMIINKEEKSYFSHDKNRYHLSTKVPLFNRDNTIIGLVGVSHDITSIKETEEKLRSSEKRLRLMAEATSAVLYNIKVSGSNYKLIWIGENIKQFGYTPEEIKKNNLWIQIIHPDDVEYFYSTLRALFENEKLFIEFRIRHKNGEYLWLHSEIVLIKDAQGKPEEIYGSLLNITDRMKVEEVLLTNKAQLTNALKIARLAHWEYDVLNDQFLFNDQFYSLLRTTAEKEGGYYMSSSEYAKRFLHPEDAATLGIEVKNAIDVKDSNYNSQVEHRIIYADGENGYFAVHFFITKDSSGKTIKTAGTTQDITQRKLVEKELFDLKENLSITLKAIVEAVISTDLKGKIILANQSAERIFGLPSDELLSISIIDLFKKVTDQKNNFFEKNGLLDKKIFEENFSQQHIINIKTKKKIIISSSFSEIKNNDGLAVGIVFVFKDITSKVEIENRLSLSRKMESIGSLASGIAHEINTPMQYLDNNTTFLRNAFTSLKKFIDAYNVILSKGDAFKNTGEVITFLNNMQEEHDIIYLAEEVISAIEQMETGINHINRIVLAMKDFAHPNSKTKSFYDINHGIKVTAEISKNTWKYSSNLELDLDPNLPLLKCQLDEINQVLLNLIVNSSHAIQDKIDMKAMMSEKGEIKITTTHNDEWITIIVKDNGIGVSEEILPRIFDPFFTTKEVGKGTGQGLPIAHDIVVNKHKGLISVKSVKGEGTSFTIELPINGDINNV